MANEALGNATLSFAATALSTVSTIVGGEQAKSILSGGAALASGTRDNVNANFYKNQISQAITKAIDSERHKVLTDLIAKRTLAVEDYPVDEMIRLVNRYHQSCSFQYGLQILLDAAVNREGVNAVLQDRNLAAVAENLRSAIVNSASLTPEGVTALKKKLSEVELQRATLSQVTQGANVSTGP